MYWILLIVIGGVIGWLASIVMRTDAQQGLFLNIVVGIVGSFIGNFLLGSLFPGTGSIASWPPSIGALVAAFVGAVILLLILNLINRGRAR
jgi:uncharacterized membrane protein YeaQ/YmgE (transglycosylase-associated protein family)